MPALLVRPVPLTRIVSQANFGGIALILNTIILYLNWVVGKSIFIGVGRVGYFPPASTRVLTPKRSQAIVIDAVEGVVAAAEQKSFADYTDSAVCPVCYFTTASNTPRKLTPTTPATHTYSPAQIPMINTTAVEHWLETVPPTCARLNSASKIYDALVRFYASSAVCPSVRFVYPIQWLYRIVWPLCDFFSLSYNPVPPYAAGPRDGSIGMGNCEPPVVDAPHWECVLLGLGFICLEVLLPLLLFGVVYQAMGYPLLRLLGRCIYASLRLVGAGAGVVIGTCVRLVPG